jgi:hypothetical protein
MITNSTNEIEARGVDQRYKANPNAASNIEGHFHPDPNGGGWINDRGIEPLIPLNTTITIPTADITKTLQPVRFLSVISRHQGAETYYLYEQTGDLKYDMGNKGTTAGVRQTSVLSSGRKIPKPDDCGTQITTYGRFNLIVNGYDKMIKWWGREAYSDFGFISPTPSPTIADVDTAYIVYYDGLLPEQKVELLTPGNTCIRFPKTSYQGLGTTTKGDVNRYDYKISFITDTGSESPLSDSATVSWTISSESAAGAPFTGAYRPSQAFYAEGKYGVLLTDFPIGPKGTVARRLYRTKNRKDGLTGAGEIYYLVDQIDNNSQNHFTDVIPDQDLTTLAPSVTDSVTISSQWKHCATWNNSMWLGGGEQNPYGIIYSKTGLPEQFGLVDYFDVGLREGGAITGLVPFYDVLLVFRERAIEIITVSGNGQFVISTLDANIGTTATNTIKLVAGYGVMFLSKDGVFAITGSVRGGSVYKVVKMSQVIEKEMGRISISALPRATATYSEREKEYWVHYPVDGDTENSRGSVFHVMNEQWSFRWADGLYSNGNGMPFSCLATDPNGWIIIGLIPNIGPDIQSRRGAPGIGLQVWSASRFGGQYLSNPVVNQSNTTFNINYIAKEKDVWESVWTDFGDDTKKKRVMSVELEVITTGNNPITLDWVTDWGYTYTSSGTQIPLRPETIETAFSEPVYQSGTELNAATWDKSKWSQTQVTRIRWDIGTSLCSSFKFRLSSANLLQILSYQIEVVGSQNKTLNQKGASSRQ